MKYQFDHTPIRVMLVDDQPITEHLLRRMFDGERDLILAACEDPMAAESLAEQFQPVIILLDLVMPGIDGLGLLSRFRRRKATQGIPIIILSSQEDSAQKALAFQNGANDFLIKLPDKIEMLARLRYHARAWFNQVWAETRVREIQRAELKYRNLFEHSRDAIFLADALSGEVIDCNLAACDLLAIPRDLLLGKDLADLLSCRHTEFFKEMFKEHVRSRQNVKSEIYIVRADGGLIPVDISATVFAQDDRYFSQWMLRDLTERKQLLQSMEETLTVAETANRMRSEFLITMEREVHPPLQMLADIAAQVGPDGAMIGDPGTFLKELHQGVTSLRGFFGDIIELARIEAGHIVLRETPMNMAGILDDVLALFIEQARAKGVTLTSHLDPDVPPKLLGDALRLRQVMFNLVKNAVQFTPAGWIHLAIQAANRSGEEQMVFFSVMDTGIGIPYSDQGTIFYPFHKVAAHQKLRSGELGLGLAISRHLVERMGGTIGVKSQVGQGSTFYFTVKLAGWNEEPSQESPDKGPRATGLLQHIAPRRHPVRPYKILLVDLPVDDRIMVQAFLQHTPCMLEWSLNGHHSLIVQFCQHQYDLLMLDASRSLDLWVEMVRRIRVMEKVGTIQRVMVIGLIDQQPGEHHPLLTAGCDVVLKKPINRDHLLSFLERMTMIPK